MVSLLLGLTSSINEWYSASNLPVEVDLGVKVATPAGTVVGQLLFGFLGDIFGRKKTCALVHSNRSRSSTQYLMFYSDGIELIIMIIGTFGQALAGNGPAVNIIGVLVFWRFLVSIDLSNDLGEFY